MAGAGGRSLSHTILSLATADNATLALLSWPIDLDISMQAVVSALFANRYEIDWATGRPGIAGSLPRRLCGHSLSGWQDKNPRGSVTNDAPPDPMRCQQLRHELRRLDIGAAGPLNLAGFSHQLSLFGQLTNGDHADHGIFT